MPNALQPLANRTLTGTTSSVSFTGITGIYKDLYLVCTYTNAVADNDLMQILVNNDTGSNYNITRMGSDGSTASTQNFSNFSVGLMAGYGGFQLTSGNLIAHFLDYSATDKHKTFLVQNGTANKGSEVLANRWANTAAITSLTLGSLNGWSFATGSTFALYGVSA
jgi:hypothetical protein